MGAELELAELEAQIRQRAEKVKASRTALEKAEGELTAAVMTYRWKREDLQRALWSQKGIGWCHRCEKEYPTSGIEYLYIHGEEWRGSCESQYKSMYRRIQSFCKTCAGYWMSCPRGGEDGFQCYQAGKTQEGFAIFVRGQWQVLADPQNVETSVGRPYIPEEAYSFGKRVDLKGWPRAKLQIGDEEVI